VVTVELTNDIKIRLIENFGWVLESKIVPEYCFKCRKKLTTQFFYCCDMQNGRCKECELGMKERTCWNKSDSIHEHFNIVKINPGALDKVKTYLFNIL
jgi:hypothetical protein